MSSLWQQVSVPGHIAASATATICKSFSSAVIAPPGRFNVIWFFLIAHESFGTQLKKITV